MMELSLNHFLHLLVEKQGSDLFISSELPISCKINGELTSLGHERLTDVQSLHMVESAMNEKQKVEFHTTKECNFAIATKEGRFRISAFWQRDQAGMVIRRIVTIIPTVSELGLPCALTDVIMSNRGLVLFVGGTGTGKSTSLAALIGYRNHNHRGHIVTIEDPIEFVHEHHKSIITQREVGVDTASFESALKSALRQSPDVILIGEIRTQETMEYALSFAETGHLCVATLHANNANQAIDRIMHLVPKEKHDKLKYDLALNLRAIVAQQLIPTVKGDGRVAAIEILLNTPMISELIKKGDISGIKDVMGKSMQMGMQTFDHALFSLYKEQRISYANALHYADSPNDLRLMIKLLNNDQQGGGVLHGATIDGLNN